MRRRLLRANNRAGVTLTEVLIALFIMALGILALLSLFPLAALQMAQAVKDDRTGTLATNADVMCRIYWRRAWQGYSPPGADPATVASEPGIVALDTGLPSAVANTSTGPSNLVLIDPIGLSAGAPSYVGTAPPLPATPPIPFSITRSNWAAITSAVPTPPLTSAGVNVRMCSVLDDMTFSQTTGEPDIANGVIDRGGRYSVAWLLQRPNNNIRNVVNLTVLVYQNRPVTISPSGEYLVSGTVTTSTSIVLNLGGLNPNLRKGGWIMDVTVPSQPAFYRIVSYDHSSGQVELQLPLQSIVPGPAATGNFMILDDLIEVFVRPVISGSTIAPGSTMQQ